MKARIAVVFALSLVMSIPVIGQTCSSSERTDALICSVPQLFGPGGMTLPNPNHRAHFAAASIATLRPVNVSIGEELATLPLGSSGSGTTFTTDAEGHLVATQDSLGPILTERANVIGKKAFSLGVAYQYFSFDKIDGVKLSRFPAVLSHELAATDPDPLPSNSFKNDYITTMNQAHLNLHQTVIYGVVGLTNRMDASLEIPIDQVHFRITSVATAVRTQPCENKQDLHTGGGSCTGTVLDPSNAAVCGEFHYFTTSTNCPDIFASMSNSYLNSDAKTDASGIGDIILRGKYEVLRGEKYTGSLGIGFRFPTGDAKNFLGSGAYGVAPFAAVTYRARLSPHARIGYQWNGRSILAGDPTGSNGGGATSGLPHSLFYSAGADYRASKRLTIAADLIGDHVMDASHLFLTSQHLVVNDSGVKGDVATINANISSYESVAFAAGAKLRLAKELVLIGNITTRMNDGGLRSNVVPLVGLSYAFAK